MISLQQQIPFSQTNLLPKLIQDYISGEPRLSRLSKYPFALQSFKDVITDKINDHTDRQLLVRVLEEQYADITTSHSVSSNIDSLLSGKTFTITAAHQPSLLMGPLFNVYKIACTINICKQLKIRYPDYNFVPVFWMGSEDHDIDELNHTYINGKKLEWNYAGTGAVGRLKTESLSSVIDELKGISANAEIISLLEEGIKKYSTFGKLTQHFINEIFKEHGLVVLNQDDVELKKRFASVIEDEIFNSRALEVLKPAIDFIETDYKLQAKPREINFFYLSSGSRERIVYHSESERYLVNNTSFSFSREEMKAEIKHNAERFSPNVIYRPLYQEIILPNLAFVGGAGELSYWLELMPLFEYFKVNYPMQMLRNSAVILNSSTQKKIEKSGIGLAQCFGDIEQVITQFVQQNMSADISLSNEKKAIEELFVTVSTKAETADVTLKGNVSAEKQKAIAALENLEAKILKAEKRKQETSVNQIRSVYANMFPDGVFQERRESVVNYYSKEFIAGLVQNLDSLSNTIKIFAE